MAFQRLRERVVTGWVIHADSPSFDATLCGYAYEGSCIASEGDSGVEEVARGKINCADCLRIIWHAKDIPNRVLADIIGRPRRVRHPRMGDMGAGAQPGCPRGDRAG
jgi:hypothetical protein